MLRRVARYSAILAVLIAGFVFIPKSVFYRNRRPTRAGRAVNRAWTWIAGAGITPYSWPGEPRGGTVALEVRGRRSGLPRRNVITWVEHDGERYFVSMLSDRAEWVRNVRAAGGEAVIVHGSRQPVRLEEVPAAERAAIIRSYMKRTRISTQEHLGGMAVDAPLEEFERIAAEHPVFRIVEKTTTG
jgi:deazaflavin-dependent oxidoreductase (nitroreductase family)